MIDDAQTGDSSNNSPNPLPIDTVARTRAPAKLNLFLELINRRDDGFHDIDTVLVPIDWCDQLQVTRSVDPGVRLSVDWLPSREIVAQRLQIENDPARQASMLSIPTDNTNLVTRALMRVAEVFELETGFDCKLLKTIPAGAGMGGASSDAASAIACAAKLISVSPRHPALIEIAAEIGSDVPFFLGLGDEPMSAIRATGRGEKLAPVCLGGRLDFVVIYPSVSLSTAKVYAASQVPAEPRGAADLVLSLANANHEAIEESMMNRLSHPARILAPQIDEIIESVWRAGCRTCQLTGSGSACFALVRSPFEARRLAKKLRASFRETTHPGGGAIVAATRTTRVPAIVSIH
ncbi:MAG: 4-(cytidine 5'-diphospho)-2-C-methyl-D-erythritol kinase [Rubripirellula sp.]